MKKVGFSVGLLFMIIVFFVTNLFYQQFGNSYNLFNNIKNNFINSSLGTDTKILKSTKIVVIKNKEVQFLTQNADLNIKRAEDNNLKLDLTVKVEEKSNINKYDINEQNENDFTKINIDENYVKGVEGTLFIPDGTNSNIIVNNLRISSKDNLTNAIFHIQVKNGSVDLANAAYLGIEAFNGDVKLNDIKETNLKVNNGKINLIGNMDKVDINMINGTVDINNNTFKNINITGNNGIVKVDTQDENIDASLTSNIGECNFNGEKINRGTLTKTIGDGSHKIKINVDMGSIRVNSQE